jgi:hypothetical protein
MKITEALKFLGLLRRIAIALESLAESHKRLADCYLAEWEHEHGPKPQPKIELSLFDQKSANARYLQELSDKLGDPR